MNRLPDMLTDTYRLAIKYARQLEKTAKSLPPQQKASWIRKEMTRMVPAVHSGNCRRVIGQNRIGLRQYGYGMEFKLPLKHQQQYNRAA